ncbi:hypothetical protein LZ32DRAFT_614271 [Colletotrichum eremochloae]|nr:hypothetical protein LZ32DRAFT_614271 [Colletotrichum eremochloae]
MEKRRAAVARKAEQGEAILTLRYFGPGSRIWTVKAVLSLSRYSSRFSSTTSSYPSIHPATRSEEEKAAAKVIMGDDFVGLIRDQHGQWMNASCKGLNPRAEVQGAQANAKKFFIHLADIALPDLLREDWSTHPLEALLPLHGDESHIEIFIDLNKELKSFNIQSEPQPPSIRASNYSYSLNGPPKPKRLKIAICF